MTKPATRRAGRQGLGLAWKSGLLALSLSAVMMGSGLLARLNGETAQPTPVTPRVVVVKVPVIRPTPAPIEASSAAISTNDGTPSVASSRLQVPPVQPITAPRIEPPAVPQIQVPAMPQKPIFARPVTRTRRS